MKYKLININNIYITKNKFFFILFDEENVYGWYMSHVYHENIVESTVCCTAVFKKKLNTPGPCTIQ